MDFIRQILPEPIIEATGWTIIHSLWQGALVSVALALILLFSKAVSPKLKYLISFSALGLILVWSGLTFTRAYKDAIHKQELREEIKENPARLVSLFKGEITAAKPVSEKKSLWQKPKILQLKITLQRNFPFIFLIWLLGVLFLLIRMSGSLIYLWRLKHRQTEIIEKWNNKITEFSSQLGIKSKVRLMQSQIAKVPMVLGYFKPVILIPASLISGLGVREIEAVIAHELAHIRRFDYIFNIIHSAIETLYFYHPAVWFISRKIRDTREQACDSEAIKLTNDKINYVRALANASTMIHQPASGLAVAFGREKGGLLKRVKQIQNQNTMKTKIDGALMATALIFLSLILLSFTIDTNPLKQKQLKENEVMVQSEESPEKDSVIRIIHKRKMAHESDSLEEKLVRKLEEMDTPPEEIEHLVEVAIVEHDEELAEIIMESMEAARAAVNMEEIMLEVEQALKEANVEYEVSRAMSHAHEESIRAAEEGIAIAIEALEELDVDIIISEAMEEAKVAMENIDFEEIISSALEALEEIEIDYEEMEHIHEENHREAEEHRHHHRVIEYEVKEEDAGNNADKEEQMKNQLEELEN